MSRSERRPPMSSGGVEAKRGHPRTSFRSNVRTVAHAPTAANATRIAVWASISSGSSAAVPRASPRHRATPWYSGVNQATAWRNVGS